jgi:protein SCO1
MMVRRRQAWVLLLIACLSIASAAWVPGDRLHGDHPPGVPVEEIIFDQNLGAQIPLDLSFQDEAGQRVYLRDYFGIKPVILLFAYYECPMLCPLVLEDLTHKLQDLNFTTGDQFEFVTVSLDPGETPHLAAEKKDQYVEQYGRKSGGRGWHFLTGEQGDIETLAQSVGIQYRYDESIDAYAHPTGVVILTPQGKISRYIFGLDYAARDLRLGLVEASNDEIGTPVDQLFLLCYRYDPVTGQYSLLINNILRIGALMTTLAVLSMVGWMFWRDRKENVPQNVLTDSGSD